MDAVLEIDENSPEEETPTPEARRDELVARVRKLQEKSREKRTRYLHPRPLSVVEDDGQAALDFPEDRKWWNR